MNTKKRITKSPKIYFTDTGILHALQNLSSMEELISHPIVGASWEGYVINQIVQNTHNQYQCGYFRTHNGAELDLVLSKGNLPQIAIEIKRNNAPKVS